MFINYCKKYKSDELNLMDPVTVYKIVLNSKYNKRFPNKYWENENSLKNSIKIIKWLLEDKLKLTRVEILDKVCMEFFASNGLRGMLCKVFNNSPSLAIMYSYPGEFKPWEFKETPRNFWNLERGIEATKWLLEDKLNFSEKDIKEKCSFELFSNNGLGGMLRVVFNGSNVDAIMNSYPNRFLPWEINRVPKNFWSKETALEATRWLIEERLKFTEKDIKEKLDSKVFMDNGLWGMLSQVYGGSPFKAVDALYPDRFEYRDIEGYRLRKPVYI